MKSLLKKLHIRSNQSSSPNELNKPLSSITGWLKRSQTQSPKSTGGVDQDVGVEEEYQIQLALELSAKEDPEAVQIEAVKEISLGPSDPLAGRYWNYSALSYDDKIVDGFYDLYGVLSGPTSSKMPSLVDLQSTPVSDNVSWEAVLVNKATDSKLLELEQMALEMAVKSMSESIDSAGQNLVQRLAVLVSDHMGGPIRNPENMVIAWRDFSSRLKGTIGSMVLPLGSLKIGLARHRALLFKVLADSVGIPCCLVKGKQYTGSDKVAVNFIKLGDGREYIVDLMADPGTIIPSDTPRGSNVDYEESCSSSPWSRDEDSSYLASSTSGLTTSSVDYMENNNTHSSGLSQPNKSVLEPKISLPQVPKKVYKDKGGNSQYAHARSPSWTEGVSSPAVRKMKVNDVSQYMMEAAKENPQLAQKLHHVLLESGVVAPPDLFTEVYEEELSKSTTESQSQTHSSQPRFLPPLPPPQRASSRSEVNVPAAAAAAAAAVAVASSMVVNATKTVTDQNIQLPVAAAATVTAAVMMAATTTSAAKQYEISGQSQIENLNDNERDRRNTEAQYEMGQDGERISDRSTGNESTVSEVSLEDVADCEIAWEDITLGERIGLGSYGEVYRGDWHGTDVAVKKFLDQEITTESLEEFRSEVRIMKKVRHPNVVLFMGAVTRAPHLSIVTEFLPRGSLYRLLHRPNNQLDIRRRLRMALDTARGMNYLHNCTPVIVHRDLKTPNLLVDKNWVVKVSDFGLSRMKYSTFLSTRSTAGTAEWMAPEVLRNEPSDEKSDVYSFGVVLWELCTLQQPWGGMNPMQVVGAVGFQHRRLEIPDDMNPVIADIITNCWQTDPKLRPTFADIMASLKPLQKLNTISRTV
ncbi:putative protein kinase TKL-CTR1-DRK-2 family [Helianthus anomalus]